MSIAAHACREELEVLVRHYHHVESEHERAHDHGSVRRHLKLRLERDRDRFEHLLTEYVPDEDMRRAWRDFLHHRGGEPPGPPALSPVLFRGQSEAGTVIEIRRDAEGELAIELDGRLAERRAGRQDPVGGEHPAVFHLDRAEFHEHFQASPAALEALREFRASGGEPPWEHAASLLSDGLVDVDFALTARGRRALAPHLAPRA